MHAEMRKEQYARHRSGDPGRALLSRICEQRTQIAMHAKFEEILVLPPSENWHPGLGSDDRIVRVKSYDRREVKVAAAVVARIVYVFPSS